MRRRAGHSGVVSKRRFAFRAWLADFVGIFIPRTPHWGLASDSVAGSEEGTRGLRFAKRGLGMTGFWRRRIEDDGEVAAGFRFAKRRLAPDAFPSGAWERHCRQRAGGRGDAGI